MPLGLSLGLWSLWTVRMRCLRRVHSSPRLRSSRRICRASALRLWALLASVVKSQPNNAPIQFEAPALAIHA